ncbi:MAG: serine/threonine protein kinase [Deltaproteobacteria bacterium]|nr:serine/threonine protein kinase [Deltaproteobacteria bacterium]
MVVPRERLNDRWEFVETISRRPVNLVYLARDVGDGHTVAVKVLQPDFARDEQAVGRFLREASVARRLLHRNLVKVEDHGLTREGRPFLVMEHLQGETLEARLVRGKLPLREAEAVVEQLAEGIGAAHAEGIVHRDLKPANCYLTVGEAGVLTVRVLDFGFAKVTDQLGGGDGVRTATNALLGTPLYMAPEQVRSASEVDPRADLWSLAVLTYELLTGAAPFGARALPDLFVEILTRPIPPPSGLEPSLPPSVDAWFGRALDRSRRRRFQSAAEFSRTFRAALRGEAPPPATESPTRVPPLARAPRGSWLTLLLGLLALVLTVIAVTLR